MARLDIHQFPCLADNYCALIRDQATGLVAAIDAPNADQVEAALAGQGWTLSHIFTTHHHGDHTDGNLALKARHACTVIGPRAEAAKIPGIDREVGDGDSFMFGETEVRVLDTPGHTLGHIAYWMPGAGVAFVGDTMFALGCGRVIEGTMDLMWASLTKLMELPPSTMIYAGHEYTSANAKFALTIEPENAALVARAREIDALRAAGRATLPTRLDIELATNPFLRVTSPAIIARLAMAGAPDGKIFGELRERKNRA